MLICGHGLADCLAPLPHRILAILVPNPHPRSTSRPGATRQPIAQSTMPPTTCRSDSRIFVLPVLSQTHFPTPLHSGAT